MKRFHKIQRIATVLIMLISMICVNSAFAGEKTLVGKVNDNYQIVTSDQVYEIADTAEGNDLAENHISARVKVTGTLEERDGMKIITVVSYQVLSE